MAAVSYLALLSDGTAQTTYTFTAASLGVADADRKIILGISMRDATFAAPSVCTVAGVTATIVKSTNDTVGDCHTHIAIADVPTGTTGDIVVTFASTTAAWCTVGTYRAVGLSSATPTATAGDIADPQSSTIDIPDTGCLVGCGAFRDVIAVATTGLNEQYDEIVASDWTAGGFQAGVATETARAVQFDGTGSGSASWAVWQEAGAAAAYKPSDIQHSPQHQAQMAH